MQVKVTVNQETKFTIQKRKRAELGLQASDVSTTHICAIVCLKITPNLINHSSQSCKAKEQSYENDFEDYNQSGKQIKHSEMEKHRALESSFRSNNAHLCNCLFKVNTQSYNHSLRSCKAKEQESPTQFRRL